MANPQSSNGEALLRTIQACVRNGERLLDDGHCLEFQKSPASRYFLVMIAQEEFAKAFILYIVLERVTDLTAPVLRAINDHACKQLVGVILDYIIFHWEEVAEMEAAVRTDSDLGACVPHVVGSAMDLLRHEKIRRWEDKRWDWAEDPGYDRSAQRIADGKKDRHKQDALYVRVGRDGRVNSTPDIITEDETREEFARAGRYQRFMESLLCGDGQQLYHYDKDRYNKAMAVLKQLFAHRI
jgi:AbiV family abortive infection protein